MQDFNLHMHTTYCDGNDSAEAMVLSAIEEGLAVAGFSGHSFTPHDTSYCMSREGTQKYIEEIRGLRDKYAGSIRLLLGIELDRYADTDTEPYDYFIGSVHYLFSKEGRRKWDEIIARHAGETDRSAPDAEMQTFTKYDDWSDVDSSPDDLCRFEFGEDGPSGGVDEIRAGMLSIAELYFDTVAEIVEATDCDIIGHFDLLTKFSEGWCFGPDGKVRKRNAFAIKNPEDHAGDTGSAEEIPFFDTAEKKYIAAWKRAIDRIFEDCEKRYKNGYRNRLENLGILQVGDKPVFEINTGAISRGYRTVPYPAADQIDYIKSKGGVLIISSDSHGTGTVCSGFEEFAYLAD